jgi:broad specificity phosphatase PhoE
MPSAYARTCIAALFALCLLGTHASMAQSAAATPGELWAALARGGHVAMIRHASAPGTGDPGNFRIGDCRTQRNLDDTGRNQARRTGDAFRANKVPVARIVSSEWCRCQETARLLALGNIETLRALNSLHGRPENEEVQRHALQALLRNVPVDGPSIVLVSHHATIGTFTGVYPQSGAIVVLKLTGAGNFDVSGSIPSS